MDHKKTCLFCGKNDEDTPLVSLTYQGQALWICSTDLPVLIHHPEQLVEHLAAAVKNHQAK